MGYGGRDVRLDPLGFAEFYDVVVDDGVVYAARYRQPTLGIHVVGDGCLKPGDPTQTSTG